MWTALPLLILLTPTLELAEMQRLEAEVFAPPATIGQSLSLVPPPALTTQTPATPPPAAPDLPPLDTLTIPVTLNAAVLGFIDFFQQRGRPIYAKWLARKGYWGPHIAKTLAKEGVPPELIYVCMIESGFQTRARSHASAVGPWQFVRRTGGAYGLKITEWVDERQDPIKATVAAAQHFKDLYERYKSWPMAMAAYNAGTGWTRRGIRRANSNDFWRLVEADTLPEQAQRYVPKAMAAMIIGQDPARFGFGDVVPKAPVEFASVSVKGGLDLARFARRLGVKLDTLTELNPELKKARTPPGEDYLLRVPQTVAGRAEAAGADRGRKMIEHRVRFGERLRHIARQYGVSRRTLRRLNTLRVGEEPPPGTRLIVPEPKSAPDAVEELLIVTEPGVEFDPGDRQVIYFPVRWGMSLADVAAFFKVTPGAIAAWNGLDVHANLQKNMALRLLVPPGFDVSTTVTVPADHVTTVSAGSDEAVAALEKAQEARESQKYIRHTIKRGETLWKIAKRYGVSVNTLREENNLRKGARMRLGATLRVPQKVTAKSRRRPKRTPKVARSTPKTTPKATPKRTPKRRRPIKRGRRYTVQRGDTLGKVAAIYGITPYKLRNHNGLPKNVRLVAGQVLYIP
jgi:membrane-bound lytic murein transglycosylase D